MSVRCAHVEAPVPHVTAHEEEEEEEGECEEEGEPSPHPLSVHLPLLHSPPLPPRHSPPPHYSGHHPHSHPPHRPAHTSRDARHDIIRREEQRRDLMERRLGADPYYRDGSRQVGIGGRERGRRWVGGWRRRPLGQAGGCLLDCHANEGRGIALEISPPSSSPGSACSALH